jgi:hypothetical protein
MPQLLNSWEGTTSSYCNWRLGGLQICFGHSSENDLLPLLGTEPRFLGLPDHSLGTGLWKICTSNVKYCGGICVRAPPSYDCIDTVAFLPSWRVRCHFTLTYTVHILAYYVQSHVLLGIVFLNTVIWKCIIYSHLHLVGFSCKHTHIVSLVQDLHLFLTVLCSFSFLVIFSFCQ